MTNNNWFVWSVDEQFDTYPTQAAAIAAAKLLIPKYLINGEWEEEVEEIKIGQFTNAAIECDRIERPTELDGEDRDADGYNWGDLDFKSSYELVDLRHWRDNRPDAVAARKLEQEIWDRESLLKTPLEKIQKKISDLEYERNASPQTIEPHRLAHGVDRDGNRFSYDVVDLFWELSELNYLKTQAEYFNLCLDEFPDELSGMYIVFENGKVIDCDIDREKLIERVEESDFMKCRKIAFTAYVAAFADRQLIPSQVNLSLTGDRAKNIFIQFVQSTHKEKTQIFNSICNDRMCQRIEQLKWTKKYIEPKNYNRQDIGVNKEN